MKHVYEEELRIKPDEEYGRDYLELDGLNLSYLMHNKVYGRRAIWTAASEDLGRVRITVEQLED